MEGSGHLQVKVHANDDLFSSAHKRCARTTNDEQESRKHEDHIDDSKLVDNRNVDSWIGIGL